MGLMMFFVLFNYTLLRNTKDALVITHSGPEVIPFLKGGVLMPMSVLFVMAYTKLSNTLSRHSLFYICISAFVSFLTIFALYLFPNTASLHPDPAMIAQLKQEHPHFQHLISLYGIWTSVLFFVFAELWGAIALNLLFWKFANFITRTNEAKRFYGIYAFLGHFALIGAGYVSKWFCAMRADCSTDQQAWGQYINLTAATVVAVAIMIMLTYRWICNNVLTDERHFDEAAAVRQQKNNTKLKLSFRESVKHVLSSPVLGLISLLVMCYGFSMNLMGILWKKQLKLQFPDPVDYTNFMGSYSMSIGVLTILIIFFSKGIVEKFGWFRGAIVTPLVLLGSASAFFMFIFFREELTPLCALYSLTPLYVAAILGAVQHIMCKSAKYSLFDPTKEMAYIPLDAELKTKGKAAVDVTGYIFSKASGGYFSGAILMLFAIGDLMTIAPYLAVAVLVTACIWIMAVFKLNNRYKSMTEDPQPTTFTPANTDEKPMVGEAVVNTKTA